MEYKLWSPDYADKSYAYLDRHIETSMFLLQNLKEHGAGKGEHQNSGNFYQVIDNGEVKGIFVLANRGNVLLQIDLDVSLSKIYQTLLKEETKITGVLGDNDQVFDFWQMVKAKNKNLEEKFTSAEYLYKCDLLDKTLLDIDGGEIFPADQFEVYNEFTHGFYSDQGLPDYSTTEQRKERFEYNIKQKQVWSLSQHEKIVSTCALNACYKNLGQVGGVYTPPEYRRKGFSKKCMQKLLYDCKNLHGLEKIILFTGENNIPAQRVYEAIGFEKIGRYGMYFGQEI